jgi:predicted TIM-barrel fold metal-dependent hydrolase
VIKAGVTSLGGVKIAGGGDPNAVSLPKWSPQIAIDWMDRNGIQLGITSVSSPGVYFGKPRLAAALSRDVNEFKARLMGDYPSRFGAFGHIPFPDVDAALKEIEYLFDTLNLDGVVMLASIDGIYQGQPEYEELYAELNRRKAVVFIHPTMHTSSMQLGMDLPGFMVEFLFDTTRCIANLIFKGVLERYPDIRFIMSHAGGTAPYAAYRLDASSTVDPRLAENIPHDPSYYLKKLYYDTALSASPVVMAAMKELIPASQILFGSDLPFAPEKLTAESVAGLEQTTLISAETKQAINNGNALKMFPRLAEYVGPITSSTKRSQRVLRGVRY